MPTRKRARLELDEEDEAPVAPPSMLQQIRNMWEFASFMQFMFMFGKAFQLDDFEIEQFEEELLKVEPSQKLADIAITLLKSFSSFRPLNFDTFEEDMRRRYTKKGVRSNPFGDDEEPRKFASLDIFTKIRVLHQLSVWTFNNPDKVREKMAEREADQTDWRMEPLGWDDDERAYFVFDDDRLYRRTDAPLPPEPEPKSKAKGKNAKKTRSAKRRRISRPVIESSPEDEVEAAVENSEANGGPKEEQEEEDDGLGGMKWELVAVTLDEYQAFADGIKRSRDANTKVLYSSLREHVLPIIEKRAEQLRAKEQRRLKELENLQKLATAKRSSRLAGKAEKRKEQEEEEAQERKRQEELAMALKEQEKQRKIEEARESRMQTREQRLKDREVKRILHEEELKKLEEEKQKAETNEGRISERHIKAEMERRQRELEKIAQEEEWTFDCAKCGMHGQNYDDGEHSIACDKCGVWQHSACHGIDQKEAERDDFHFVCTSCKRKQERESQPRIPPLKFRFSSSPQLEQKELHITPKSPTPASSQPRQPSVGRFDGVRIPDMSSTNGTVASTNGAASNNNHGPQRVENQVKADPGLSHARDAARNAAFTLSSYQHHPAQTGSSPWNSTPNPQNRPPSGASSVTQQQRSPPNPHQPSTYLPPIANFKAYSPPTAGIKAPTPPTANFNVYRPPSQGSSFRSNPTQPRPSVHGVSRASPPPIPRHAPASSKPSPSGSNLHLNGHGPPAQTPPAAPPRASPSLPPPHGQIQIGAQTPAAPHFAPRQSPVQAGFSATPKYLSTPQYNGPSGPQSYHPSASPGYSPVKHESPRPIAGQAPSNSPQVVPPSTTLSPSYGNLQQNYAPVKKPTSEQTQVPQEASKSGNAP